MAVVWALCVFLAFFVGHVASTSCGTTLSGSSGYLSSENFPNNFPKQTCVWTITVSAGRIIKLSFLNFTLNHQHLATDCKGINGGTRLSITNVASHDNNRPDFELCGIQIPAPVYSVGNSIQVTLTVNNVFPGFNASYEEISENDICPAKAQLSESSGVITSPFYPRKFPDNQDCIWQIKANKGRRIKLEIAADLDIIWCNNCVCDYLEIQDGFDTDGAASGKLCKQPPGKVLTYYSVQESLKLRFVSDGVSSFQTKGFKATYTFLNFTPPVCPVEAIPLSGNGTLSSPGYPAENYIASKTCTWNITAPAGKQVKFAFTDFALGSCSQGCTDVCTYVEVHDGPSASSPLLARFCHGSTQEAKISSGNQMFVKFHSGFTIDRGFEAEYSVTTEAPSPTVTRPPTQPTTTTAKPPTTTGAIVTATVLSVTLPILAVPIFWP